MSIFSGNLIISKAVVVSATLTVGSGTCYLIYQLYAISKQVKRLNIQMAILTDKLYRAQADINELHLQLQLQRAAFNSLDDNDDEFVDAAEEKDYYQSSMNGFIPSSLTETETETESPEVKPLTPILDDLLKELDEKDIEENIDELKSNYMQLHDLIKRHPHEDKIYWRISQAAYLLAQKRNLPAVDAEQRRKEFMDEAREAAHTAVKLDPQSGEAHRWMAIILGSETQHLPVGEQIKNAFIIREHIESALRLKPNDSLVYHMMGRWCYSAYMLTWMERKLASALFGTPPTSTLEEALTNFKKAEELNPLSSISNQLYLSKCYIAKGNYKTAVQHLHNGMAIKPKISDDLEAQEEVAADLKYYQSYAS